MMDRGSPHAAADAAAPSSDAALQHTDVLVIGGGPASSSAATLLARRAHHVTVLEKDHHPRFHSGESRLPANLPLLDQLGVAEQVRAIGMQQWGAEFTSPWDGRNSDFRLAEAWDKSMPYAYQVHRSQFDEILIRNAAHAGAQVIEGCRVRSVEFQDARSGDAASAESASSLRIEAEHQDGRTQRWQARYLVDASGRDTFLANRLGAKRRNPKHNSAAMFGHFSGAQRLANATLTAEVEATGNYSYSSTRSHGERYVLVGDAFAFIDPVSSSGVMLAMHSAFVGADAVDACLRAPARARAALREFDRSMRRGPHEFTWFIYRVTTPAMRELIRVPRNLLRMKEALLSVLAGDIYGRTPIWKSVRAFKMTYGLLSLLHPLRSALAARRSLNIRPA